jgi:hypothetical protein
MNFILNNAEKRDLEACIPVRNSYVRGLETKDTLKILLDSNTVKANE